MGEDTIGCYLGSEVPEGRDMEIRGGWKVKEGVRGMEKREQEREREREREREEVIPPCHASVPLYT